MDAELLISAPQHAEVFAHYRQVMSRLDHHFGGTPVVWVTYPGELGGDAVYHKDVQHVPPTIPTVAVRTSTGVHTYVTLNPHNLTWLIEGRFAVEIHGWSPMKGAPERAAYGRIVLSPHGAAGDDTVLTAARILREALKAEGLEAIPILDGFRGITLWIPFDDGPDYDRLGHWIHDFAARAAQAHPQILTVDNLLAERGDRVYLGTKSNHPGMGSLLPYALRGTPSLEVSVPVEWDDLGKIGNGDVVAANFAQYDAANGDLFARMSERLRQSFGDRAPASGTTKMFFFFESPAGTPRNYVITAALQVLADGKPHTAEDILAQAVARHLLPHSTNRKYVYTALREYIVRAIGAGRRPEIVQVEGEGTFRLNREPDTWPEVQLRPRVTWLEPAEIERIVAQLEATATGADPTAFELAVTEAFTALGFLARHVGGNAAPDAVIDAPLGVRGYRTIVECKTGEARGIVSNPRPDEPARFRDEDGAKYALVIGPSFANLAALDDELQQHGVALWTVADCITCLRKQFDPAALEPLMAPGRIADRLAELVWSDEHGDRKRVAVVADIIHRQLWAAQRAVAASVSLPETPVFSEDSVLLMVDEVLAADGVVGGATRAILRQAIQRLEADGVLVASEDSGLLVVVPAVTKAGGGRS